MKIKIKLAEKSLQRASRNLDKWEKLFYERQSKLQHLYKKTRKEFSDRDQIEADMAAITAWQEGIVIKEDK